VIKYVFVLMALLSQYASADVDTTTESERRYLIKVANEIAHLEQLTQKAEAYADPDARVTLDYVALKRDLAEMRRALESHLRKPSRSPRKLEPLQFSTGARSHE
jgi:RAQPRD family integrative conjugative element protein